MKHSRIFFSFLFIISISPAAICMQQDPQSQEKRESLQTANSVETEEPAAPRTEDLPFLGRPIVRIEFRGNKAFTSETLFKDIKYVKLGKKFNSSARERLQADLDRLRAMLYIESGYLQARFLKPELENTPAGVKITIPVEEGVAYRTGEIEIVDAKVFSPDEVRGIIGLKKGQIIKGYSGVNRGIEALKRKYQNRGYVQFDAFFEPAFYAPVSESNEAIADVKFVLEEGERYTVSKISFTGSGAVNDEFLRTKLSIKAGEVYNYTLLEKSLDQLNRTGILELVKEEDVNFITSEKAKLVELVFRLEKKWQQ